MEMGSDEYLVASRLCLLSKCLLNGLPSISFLHNNFLFSHLLFGGLQKRCTVVGMMMEDVERFWTANCNNGGRWWESSADGGCSTIFGRFGAVVGMMMEDVNFGR
jgi:hypothetical protein